MSNNKDQTSQPVFNFKTHVQQLTDGWNQLQDQVTQSQFEADLAKAQKEQNQDRVQEVEAQLKQSEELRTQSAARILELLGVVSRCEASEAKVQALEARLKASEELRIKDQTQAEAQVQALQKDLKSRSSELERFKTQVQGKLDELETVKNKALGVLAAEQARSSALEQALASEKASHSEKMKEQEAHHLAQRNDFHAKWEARYHKDTNGLRAALRAHGAPKARGVLAAEQASNSALEQALASEKAAHDKLKDHVNKFYAKWEERYHKDTDDLKAKLEQAQAEARPGDKLEISRLREENIRLTQLTENQESQFTAIKAVQNANLGEVRRLLEVKENEVASLRGDLEDAKWKLDTEQKKFEALQQEQRENAEYVMEMRDKNLLQVEIQLEKSQKEVQTLQQVQAQLEKSQAEVHQVRGTVKEMEDKLKETEAKLAEAQAPKKRGRPWKADSEAENSKKRKVN